MLIECIHLQKETLLNEAQDMSQKKINRGVLIRFIGNPYVHQTPENNCFMLLVQLEQIKYSSIYEYIYFGFF